MVKSRLLQVFILAAAMLALTAVIGIMLQQTPNLASAADTGASENMDTINVQGHGAVTVTPDLTIIQLGVETEGKTVEEAQSSAAEKMNQVKAALLKLGVTEENMKSVQFNVRPNYRYDKDGQRFLDGYIVTHMLSVKHNNIDEAGKLVDAASAAGANRIDHVQFTVKDTTAVEIEALEKAFAHAKQKAEALAKVAGKEIVDVHQINENGGSGVTPFYGTMEKMAMDSAARTTIESGEIDVEKRVQVTFVIR